MSDSKTKEGVNRFGQKTITMIPEEAPLNPNPGHKLRTSNVIVNRQALSAAEPQIESAQLNKMAGQKIQFYSEGNQIGVIRLSEGEDVPAPPNQFKMGGTG